MVVFAVIVLSIAGVFLYRGFHPPPINAQSPVLAAQTFVRQQLGSNYAAQFGGPELTHIEQIDGKYKVTGYVEAINRNTAKAVSYTYTSVVYQNGSDWYGDHVDLLLQ